MLSLFKSGEPEMVWICLEEGEWICWAKNVEDGSARQEEEEDLCGCSERGHAEV